MQCPYCKSDHTKKLSTIYYAGTTVSKGTGFAIGSQPGQFGTVNTTTISRTIEAENAKAPEKWSYFSIFAAFIMWIVPMIGLGMAGSRFVPVPFLIAMAYVIYRFPSIHHQRKYVYPELMCFYNSTSKCMNCNMTFQDNFELNPAVYDWTWKRFIRENFSFTKKSILLLGAGAAYALYPFVFQLVTWHTILFDVHFTHFFMSVILIISGLIVAKKSKQKVAG
ncbi:hypothetical protein RGU72_12965 [Undibacterium sp. 5I1]|uniref:hypothetical protein n=1 Tax=unclassified Undibacterium TaxID=2630295 RepID=UPI002AB43BA0|nr:MULTISPECIES: hypothetical protein [unclassified Undibacterium]MDY7539164.1 hypothetical protein [Undibacterium sp. 5I1]MEB0232408.1 hypothetical protein [Undibacterium sp. 10I3]MEB0257038.1 hypothetical protein [Undibacterium sp. 5I1]